VEVSDSEGRFHLATITAVAASADPVVKIDIVWAGVVNPVTGDLLEQKDLAVSLQSGLRATLIRRARTVTDGNSDHTTDGLVDVGAPLRQSVGIDHVFNYQAVHFSLGVFFVAFHGAIGRGDGDRVVDGYWKQLQLIFLATGKTNYALESVFLTCLTRALLPQTTAHSITFDRFANILGTAGKCVPRDRLVEFYNRYVKDATLHSGAHRIEAMKRKSKVGPKLRKIQREFDEVVQVAGVSSGLRKPVDVQKDVRAARRILRRVDVGDGARSAFRYTPGRQYNSFQLFPRNLFSLLDPGKVVSYLADRRHRVSDYQTAFNDVHGDYYGSMVLPGYKYFK
jgi:hypothetical protein